VVVNRKTDERVYDPIELGLQNKGRALYQIILRRMVRQRACRYEDNMAWQLGCTLQIRGRYEVLAWQEYSLLRYEVLEQSKKYHFDITKKFQIFMEHAPSYKESIYAKKW